MATITKIVDTKVISNSRADSYWNENGFDMIYKRFRKGVDIPAKMRQRNNALDVQKSFNLAGFQFGNWTSNEDRYNYLCALYLALYDMNKVLKFKNNNIGFKALSISFGARGVSSAVAHYEPHHMVINITRYERNKGNSKVDDFISSGGIGSFAHEYAHYLDYYIGQYYELKTNSIALTEGRSLQRKRINDKGMRGIVEDILQIAFWKNTNTDYVYREESDFYKRILATSEEPYFVRRNEIFARLFEQYISFKLQKMNIYNRFLSETKYDKRIYMSSKELAKVVPLFDKLIIEIRKL